MQRVTWTDERLDDLSWRMDAGFDRADREFRDLRGEMQVGFADVDREFRDLRGEMRTGFTDVRDEIDGLRSVVLRLGGGMIASVVAASFLHAI